MELKEKKNPFYPFYTYLTSKESQYFAFICHDFIKGWQINTNIQTLISWYRSQMPCVQKDFQTLYGFRKKQGLGRLLMATKNGVQDPMGQVPHSGQPWPNMYCSPQPELISSWDYYKLLYIGITIHDALVIRRVQKPHILSNKHSVLREGLQSLPFLIYSIKLIFSVHL